MLFSKKDTVFLFKFTWEDVKTYFNIKLAKGYAVFALENQNLQINEYQQLSTVPSKKQDLQDPPGCSFKGYDTVGGKVKK